MYALGWGVKKNHHKARKWISTAAQHEPTPNDAGQYAYEIGESYHLGVPVTEIGEHHYPTEWDGVRQNIPQAIEWYRLASELGWEEASYELGLIYHQNDGYHQDDGVTQDKSEAAKWYLKAAQQGHGHCWFPLGKMYANGW